MSRLSQIKSKPNKDLIDLLENLLKEAKNGEIQTMVYLANCDNGDIVHGLSETKASDMIRWIGGIRLLEKKLLNITDEEEYLGESR